MINSENGLLVVSVLLNVRDRDIGGFVEEAKRVVPKRVVLPTGYYLGWSGQYENQEHARRRLELVFPIVIQHERSVKTIKRALLHLTAFIFAAGTCEARRASMS